ncbi:MAG: hypothetical protein ACLPOO_14825 [Terriglobales bacterium]
MENYFNYFTEIEEHFQRRRGTALLLSNLDWVMIEVWKDAGIPLDAVLRGIDEAFDKYERRPSKTRKINGLAWCAQAVLVAAEDMKEAAVGTTKPERQTGFEKAAVAAFLRRNADQLEIAKLPERTGVSGEIVARETASTLREIAAELDSAEAKPRLEDLERKLTVAEEKLFAVLLAATPDDRVVAVRAEADRELAPYRSKMSGTQIEQLQKQFVHKRLLEKYGVPRLSLFYM